MRSGGTNQRDFYRVDCRAVVLHRPVEGRVPASRGAETWFGESESLELLRELRRLDHENAQLLQAVGERDRNLGNYLHVVNRKFELLTRHLLALSPDNRGGEEQTVSLSEGGLVFRVAESFPEGQVLALRVSLLPSHAAVAAYATVIKAQALAGGGSQLTVNFERLQDADRQLLARHVMQVQMAEQRRKAGRE